MGRRYQTTTANTSTSSKVRKRRQGILNAMFSDSPILGNEPEYSVEIIPVGTPIVDEDGEPVLDEETAEQLLTTTTNYPAYSQLLTNGFKANDQQNSRLHWGFTNNSQVNATFAHPDLTQNKKLFTKPGDDATLDGTVFAFAPNLLPPEEENGGAGKSEAFTAGDIATGKTVVNLKWISGEGWQGRYPLVPQATSGRISKSHPPTDLGSAGSTTTAAQNAEKITQNTAAIETLLSLPTI